MWNIFYGFYNKRKIIFSEMLVAAFVILVVENSKNRIILG